MLPNLLQVILIEVQKSLVHFFVILKMTGKEISKDLTSDIFPHQELNKIFAKPVGRSIAIHFSDISGDGVEDLVLQNIGSRYTELEWEQYPYIYIRDGNKFLPTKNKTLKTYIGKTKFFLLI